jgi:hypothetical protein
VSVLFIGTQFSNLYTERLRESLSVLCCLISHPLANLARRALVLMAIMLNLNIVAPSNDILAAVLDCTNEQIFDAQIMALVPSILQSTGFIWGADGRKV